MVLTQDRTKKMRVPRVPSDLPGRAAPLVFLWAVVFVVVLLQVERTPPSRELIAWESVIVLALALVSIGRATLAGFWSPASLFLMVLAVFHLGLVAHIITGVDPEFPRPADYVWYQGPAGVTALALTTLGIAAYTLAVLAVSATWYRPRRDAHQRDASPREESSRHAFSRVGSVILLAGTIAWFVISILEVGAVGLVGSYMGFLAATSDTSLYLTYPAIGVGLGLTLISPARPLQKVALAAFALFAVIGFFLGLRGEVLFPIAAAVAVLATRKRMPNIVLVAFSLVVLLTAISAAQRIRQLGIGESGFSLKDATPLGALGELGSTLRVVATVVTWHDLGGEPFRGGDTYTVAFVRLFEQLASTSRVAASSDFRLFNSEISARAGGIGGSIIGEAYHNFAALGVVVALAVVGLILGRFSIAKLNASELAVYVVVAVPLFNHIRNSFVPVLPAVIFGLILVLMVIRFSSPKTRYKGLVGSG